ncbi:MAG: ion channel [Rhizomicrobium sp.]
MKIDDPGDKTAIPATPRARAMPQRITRGRLAVVRGQDGTRFTDIYHQSLMAPWWLFFLGLLALFILINLVFAGFYMTDPNGLANAHPGDFWERFVFSVQTLGSVPYTEATPRTRYVDVIVMSEAFVGILYIGVVTALLFARLSRPSARFVFSKCAVILRYDGVPTLMFRTANQRGNQVLDASINVTLARSATSPEGITMRRFEELQLVRSRTSLFALSWTVMHRIDETSPLHGITPQKMEDNEMEIIVLLSGRDDILADTIYARHAYGPEHILWQRRFVDVISTTPLGRLVVYLNRFHDREPHPLAGAASGG